MKQVDRLNRLIDLLKKEPQTIETIEQHFDGELTPRQIRRLIDTIKSMGITQDDFESTGRANKKTWYIKPDSYERNTRRLVRGVLPQVFAKARYNSVERLIGETDKFIDSSHFYETEAFTKLDNNLEIVLCAIDEQKKLRITQLVGDATSVASSVTFPIDILPIKVIYHRGCFYLATVSNSNQQVLTFQIDQLILETSQDTFELNSFTDIIDTNLRKRFGISQNIDNEVYTIKLQFSSITGGFVKQQFWHNDLSEPIQMGESWIFTFECGINRELVGWLFQWMSNVKILGPPKLIELYNEQLDQMMAMRHLPDNAPLKYTNKFAPKV